MHKAPMAVIPPHIVSLADYEPCARERMTDVAWTYLQSGAADEITLRRNIEAFQDLHLRGRVLGEVTGGHTRLNLFGHIYDHPIFLAPLAYQKLFHTEGERATALGAAVTQTLMILSTLSTVSLEEVAQAETAPPLWFQLYLQADHGVSLDLIHRAEREGYRALVITVDAALAGIRNREQRAGFHLPPHLTAVNLANAPAKPPPAPGQSLVFDSLMKTAPGWSDIEWVLSEARLPVILKGIVAPEDADHACRMGVHGIIVSNHGGRVLDTLPAAIDALPAVVAAVAGRVPVLLDGGVRRGTDVFKALALGASAVLIGRPYIHALAAAGPLGVAHAVRTLREELEIVMALSGTPTLDRIRPEHLFI
ncbi:alpha-hydroxy acid oxidase [Asticcacaulis sp. AND118]|uniref:alpha-hydroxy acid oxidase n=1 Tax=Asticcacaulis sp. AND118 TaxID=2840468 RepID=UPI001CFFA8CE|nr:alpha-hydroxy acid oxidase [Asticcacaulis sp. AND118]UDF05109.1 alpha-hydroxy-acid oxidizing protein [Asticcacaulis sp. AND118]